MGQLAAEYATGTIAASPCTTCYVAADHLGSTRALWDTSGLKARYDYHPFGEAIAADRNGRTGMQCAAGVTTCYNGPSSVVQRFTGQLRDEETGLDYFKARYMASGQGRFMSADVPFADQQSEDPQSWNLYSYVGNNPLSHIDTNGRGKLGIFYKVVLKPIIREGREVMYRKTTEVRLTRDEARRLLRKEGANVIAPGRKSAKNAAGKGAKEHGAHGKGAGEDGPHFHTSDHNGGHSFYSSGAVIPGANLGKDIFGDNLFGEAVDLFNPLSDIQTAVDIFKDVFGPSPFEPAQPDPSTTSVKPEPTKKPRTPEAPKPKISGPCYQLDGQPCGGGA